MANNNAPFGFVPARHASGLGHANSEYEIAGGLAENIAQYDIVKSNGAGGIVKAAAGDAILGVFLGVNYVDPTGAIEFKKMWRSGTTLKAGTKAYALVIDDPNEIFHVQTSGTLAAADIGQLVNLVDGAPDDAFETSRQTVGAAGGTQFRVEKILQQPIRIADANNNTAGFGMSGPGQYSVVVVKPAKHERGGAALAVAV